MLSPACRGEFEPTAHSLPPMPDAARLNNPLPCDRLIAGYQPESGVFDEMIAPSGLLRSSWQQFASGLNHIGTAGLSQRAEQVKRLLRENGVTYNAVGAPKGPDRPWELDPIPLLFDKQSWGTLADGLKQRATLLNLILADVYGPQRLVREGVLPPPIVFDQPGYLLPCRGIPAPKDVFLCLYAAHLARQPDGQWLVLTDRTRGPSGIGYTLENRLAVSRTLPGDFESLHIERLASFFIALRDRLISFAPTEQENPRVVLLSPGVSSATSFEDGYLSRYLGYTLVEGGDLTVRRGGVYMKTLGGLLPVDVILRRIPDGDCDPLELEPNSPIGTAGLVQAVRDRTIAITNAVGSGFLEAPALAAFLPQACRLLMGEDLRCPSLPTWWCGESENLLYVETNLSQLNIRHALKRRGSPPIAGASLTADQRRQLIEQIRRRPEHFVAQAPVERSTAPVWDGSAIKPHRLELRTFAVSAKSGYQILPGGLARVFAGSRTIGESMAAGETSKDVWVLGDETAEHVTLLNQPEKPVDLRRGGSELPSRIADNLFWLGRHAERAEAIVRHLRSCMVRLASDFDPSVSDVSYLVEALSDVPGGVLLPSGLDEPHFFEMLRQNVVQWLFDSERPVRWRIR